MAETHDQGYEKRCAHDGCACLMQEDEEFCSDACEAGDGGDTCACGHLACESEVRGEA